MNLGETLSDWIVQKFTEGEEEEEEEKGFGCTFYCLVLHK